MLLFATMGSEIPVINPKKKYIISGDSTIAAFACRSTTIAQNLFTSDEINDGYSATNIAVPGHSINQQLAAWNSVSNKLIFDVIIIQIGLNDMQFDLSTILSDYQNYIDSVNSTKRSDAEIYISCMLPCKGRWDQFPQYPDLQNHWIALNQAIMGLGSNPITGVSKRNNYHVSLLADSQGYLLPQYDCGDNIHETQSGADIIRNGFRNMIFN